MAVTINPVVDGTRNQFWPASFLLHMGSAILGGSLTAGAIWVLFIPVRGVFSAEVLSWLLVFAICSVAVLEAAGERLRVPSRSNQVPTAWLARYRSRVTYSLFGFGLGAAFYTRIYYYVTWLVFGLAGLTRSALLALAIGAAFGLGRAGMLLMVAGTHERDEVLTRVDSMLKLRRYVRPTLVVAEVVLLLIVLSR